MKIKRRTWIKAAAAAMAAAALPGCKPQAHKLVPYLLPDDEIVPGVADWYASTCDECSAGCGVLVRTMEGRAKKIEGNPDHPVNEGKLCARGQAAVQSLYHPDRLREPRQRNRKSSGAFEPITWQKAIGVIAEQLRSAHGRIIMISRPLSGTSRALLLEFMDMVGGRLYWYDPAADVPLRTALSLSFGHVGLPHYDLAGADYLVSFGTPFLEQWLSPVSYGVAFGRMRQGRPTVRGHFVHIEPRLSLTAASADRWIPIRPGTEGTLALGLGHLLMTEQSEHRSNHLRGSYEALFGGVDLKRIAIDTDVPTDELRRLAKECAGARHPLVIGGGAACSHTNATQSLMAINGLNALLANIGQPGGVRFYRSHALPNHGEDQTVPWLTERLAQALLGEFESGQPSVLLVNECNPVFSMPPAMHMDRLFARASFVASFGPLLDESASLADVVCPSHHWLEGWGDHVPDAAMAVETTSLRQPAVRPLYDSREFGDTVLELARAVRPGFLPVKSFAELVKHHWTSGFGGISLAEQEQQWISSLQQGGRWKDDAKPLSVTARRPPTRLDPASFMGDEQLYPLHLYPYPSMTMGHSGAHLPWLQELPDTLTTAMWGTWVEINPATAARYGIAQGDIVRIESSRGSIEAPAMLFPGIRPDVVAMPVGQGHTSYGRYATGRGVNPLQLAVPAFDHESGAFATGATRVQIEGTGRRGRLVLLQQPAVDASELIQVDPAKPIL
jgi:anaerobic selenocysteine-containing dehydrogenase